jgi:hypothetical protein
MDIARIPPPSEFGISLRMPLSTLWQSLTERLSLLHRFGDLRGKGP